MLKYTLIESITGLLPAEKTGLKNGTKEKPADPANKTIEVKEGPMKGTWTFKGWQPAEQTVNGKDIAFEGIWEFKEATT